MLTPEEEAMLEIAAAHLEHRTHLARAAREQLELSTTRFVQKLDRLVRTPAAIARDPMTCRRVRELADGR